MKKQNKSHHTPSLSKQVDGLLATWNKTGSPGYAIAVLRQGKVVHTGGYGMADIENSIPLSTQSVFDIGSDSKKFVALSLLLLARQKELSLDDEIQKYLPEIRRYREPITIRHLIHHTSGLRDYFSIAYLSGTDFDNVHSMEQVIALIARQKDLNFNPGTEHLYSNSGYYLLAEVVKRVSGLSLRTFAQKNIFAPLGMKNTHFHDDHSELVDQLAIGYAQVGGRFEVSRSTMDVVGAGGLYSTVEDLGLWEANFYNNILGGHGQDLLEEMVAPGKLNDGEPLAYASGLVNTSYRGLKVVEHGGSFCGYRSQMMRFPDQGLTVICLANFDQANAYRISKQIADIYLAEEFPVARDEQRVIDFPLAELEARTGFYRGVQASNFWELTVQEGKLMVQGHDMGMTFQIAPVQPDRFIALDTCLDISIDFGERSATGAATMSVRVDNHFSEHLESVDAVAIEQSQLQKYCGDYRSEEMGVTYTLTFEDGKIAFRFGSLPDTHLQPINRTLFNCPTTGLMEFIFDADDQVSGFELNLCRARKISFVKVGQKISHTESLAKQVDTLFSDWDKPDAPGCAIGIVRDGQLLYGRGYGMANLEHGIPLSTSSVLDIASDSKKFVALCALLLARQGKLSLDEEVQTYLPDIRRYEQPITLRHLIHHTSGLRDYVTFGWLAGVDVDANCPDEEWLSLIARQKGLNFDPGTEHFYSNTGYVLLAEVIKRVSGMSLREFSDLHIFAPLGMKNTHFHDDYREIVPNRASGYCLKDKGGFEMWVMSNDLMGGRGLFTTVEDLCLWDANFYNNVLGGYGNELIEEMITPGTLANGEPLDYALGYIKQCYRGLLVVLHGGGCLGFKSQMMCFPEQRFTVICTFNRGDANPSKLCRQVADLYLTSVFKQTSDYCAAPSAPNFIDLSVCEMESKAGFFHDAKSSRIWGVSLQEESLTVNEYEYEECFKIAPVAHNQFRSVDFHMNTAVDFEVLDTKLPIEIHVRENDGKPMVFKRMEHAPVTTDQLQNYCGDYASDELGVTYRLCLEDHKIVFTAKGLDKADLQTINRSFFVCPGCGIFQFAFDQQSRVTGMVVSQGRVRGIFFVKVGEMPEPCPTINREQPRVNDHQECALVDNIGVDSLPITARVSPAVDDYYGIHVIDSYHWMEDANDPDWLPFLKGQNAVTRQNIDAINSRNALAERIARVSGEIGVTRAVKSAGNALFYEQRPVGADNFMLFVRDGSAGDRILIDPSTMTQGNSHFSLDWWVPSFDGSHIVYGLAQSGSEASILHVMVVATGAILPERIPDTDWGVTSWLPDGSGFFYIGFTGKRGTPQFQFNTESRLHLLGTDPASDRVMLKAGMFADIPMEPLQSSIITCNAGCDYVLACVLDMRVERSWWSAPLVDFLAGTPSWAKIAGFDDLVVSAAVHSDDLYLLTNRDAVRGQIVRTSLARPDFSLAKTVVPQGDVVLDDLNAARDGVYVTILDGGIQRLGRIGAEGMTPVALPFDGSIDDVFTSLAQEGAYFQISGWLEPSASWRVGSDGLVFDTGITPRPEINTSTYEARRCFATARDGTSIPYTILARKGWKADGKNPTLVHAYGAYQACSMMPRFAPRTLPFLDAGGVYVTANVRGGGEYGREWHKGGQKATKPNTWNDLIAVCEAMISEGITTPSHLAIVGTSAGGIAVGRAMTERPDLFSAVISNVGWSNPIRYMAEQNMSDIDEWGPITDAASFNIMYAMDTYHAVKTGVRYPAVLCMTGANDPRVAPWHATKLTARLQAASTSGKSILLRVDFEAGHGIGSTRSQVDAQLTDMYSFVLWQTGVREFQPST